MERPFSAVAAAATLLAACAVHEPTAATSTFADPAVRDEGRKLAEALCASCHAVGVDGMSPLAEAPPLRTLSQRYPITALEEALAEGVLTGHPAMPEFEFNPAQIDALIAYLQSIQERQAG